MNTISSFYSLSADGDVFVLYATLDAVMRTHQENIRLIDSYELIKVSGRFPDATL
jgi:hypothetical protein